MKLKLLYINENLLIEHSQKQIDAFNAKFGEGSYDKFKKALDRLKKNDYTTDIQYYLKDSVTKEGWEELYRELYDDLDVDGKEIPTPANSKELLVNADGEKMYFVTDYTDMIDLSNGTGTGKIGGRKTGWCVGSRYAIPFGQVKVSQAEKYFYEYIEQAQLDNQGYYVILQDNNPLFCVLVSDNTIVDITDSDDNDHYIHLKDTEAYNSYLFELYKQAPNCYQYFQERGIVPKMEEVATSVYVYKNDGLTVPTNVANVEISSEVKTIESHDFEDCYRLRSIVIPDNVTKIEYEAFKNCTALQEIKLSNTLVYIGAFAFDGCSSLTEISLPDSITELEEAVFYNCEALKEIKLPSAIRYIESSLFKNCISLKTVKIPNQIESIEVSAFMNCTNLDGINIPSSVINIEPKAFYNCTSLKNLTLSNGLEIISSGVFAKCTSLESVTIPSSVIRIGSRAFMMCDSLQMVVIDDGVQQIDDNAFAFDDKLKQITIPESVTDIDKEVFYQCSKDLVIRCKKDSVADTYAHDNNIKVSYI